MTVFFFFVARYFCSSIGFQLVAIIKTTINSIGCYIGLSSCSTAVDQTIDRKC